MAQSTSSRGPASTGSAVTNNNPDVLAGLVWAIVKFALYIVAFLAVCAIIAAALAVVVIIALSAVVVASLAVWLRLYVDPALVRVQVRLLKWAALIGGVGGAGLFYASFRLPVWIVQWANQSGGDVLIFLKVFGIILLSLPLASLGFLKLQRPHSVSISEWSWYTGYAPLTLLLARVMKKGRFQMKYMNFIQDSIIAGVPLFFVWWSGGFWVWVYATGLAVAQIVFLWDAKHLLGWIDDWLGGGGGAAAETESSLETAAQ